jgi:hypothetical protein
MYAILPCIRRYFAYTGIVSIRSCLVSFTDSEGIEHSVRVSAESLYEAAVEAIAAFKQSLLVDAPLPTGARLTICVKAPEDNTRSRSARFCRGSKVWQAVEREDQEDAIT